MPGIRRSTFVIGFLIGALIAAIVWYYQKSTSAEDGALNLLDRLAQTQARVRDLEQQAAAPEVVTSKEPAVSRSAATGAASDDLQLVPGIGPTYAQRLKDAGVTTYAALAALTSDQLRAIVGGRPNVSQWIADAQHLAG